jgi:hypothetical protein
MTEVNQLLDTEIALNALMKEMLILKSAADQIGEAKTTGQYVAKAAEGVIQQANVVIKNSNKIQEDLIGFRGLLEANELQIAALNDKVDALNVTNIDLKKRSSGIAINLERVHTINKVNRILIIICLVITTITLALSVVPLIRALPLIH